ncbi:MAG: transposase [Candidatus Omnitrophota bacterium]|nr:transposase [Candidatus Omnitrophota bacterium]
MPRIQIEGAIYYLIPAGNYGEPIFRNVEDYDLYMELLARYKNKHNFQLFAFCLAPDSINLLIEPSSSATISQIMHDLNPGYTKYFNGKYNRVGRLFRERYRIVLIEKAPNLLKMTSYIHLRPKLLHLTNDISSYKYTSFLTYLTEERKRLGTEVLNAPQGNKLNMAHEVAYVLNCLKDKSYQQFVNEMEAGEVEDLNKALEKEKVIGSTDFRKEAAALVNSERQAPEAAGQPMPIEKPETLPEPTRIEKLDVLPETTPVAIEKPDILPQPTPIEKPDILPEPASIEKPEVLPEPTPIEKPNILSQPAPIKKPDILPHPIPVQIPRAGSRLVSIIWTFAVTACLVILSLISSMSFTFINILRLKESAKQEIARKDTELQKTLDMGKTYETKLASYKAIIERLQAEKQKSENELSKARLSPKLKSGAPLQQKRNKP